MYWFFLSVILFSNPVHQAPDSSLDHRSKIQIQQYIDAVTADQNVDLNLWALTEVSKNNSETKQFTANYILQKNGNHPALQVFTDTSLVKKQQLHQLAFSAQSPLLLVAYLLEDSDNKNRQNIIAEYVTKIGFPTLGEVNYQRLTDAIIGQEPITSEILPARYFHPLHFLFFYNRPVMQANLFAPEYLSTAIEKWSFSSTPSLRQSMGLSALFRIFYIQSNYSQTDRLYHPLIDNNQFPNSQLKLNIMRALDYSMYRLGYYNRSLEIIRDQSLPLAQFLNQNELAVKIKIAEGAYLYRIGKIEESKQVYLDVQNSLDSKNTVISRARILNNLAINYWKSGEFDRYINLQFQALDEAQKENSYDLQFDIFKNLFNHYRAKNDFDSAKNYLEAARVLAQKEESQYDLAQLNFLEGTLYRDLESNYRQAIFSFDNALIFISYQNNYNSYQNILTEKAHLLEKQKKHKEAKKTYVQMLGNAIERDDRRNQLFASFSKANIHLKMEEMDSARVMLDTLNTQNLDALDFYQLVKAKTVQTRYLEQTGSSEEAINLLQPVINQIVNRSRESGDLQTGFWQVEPEYLNAFETFTNLLITSNHPERAVEALDRLKTINDAALYQNPLVRSKVLSEKELSEYTRLTQELDNLRRQLLTVGEDQAEIQQKIDERSAQKSSLDRKITTNADSEPVSVNEIQRRMNAHQRLLHITELNDTYYLATISRTDVRFKKISITPELRHHFEETISQIATGTTDLTKLHRITKLLSVDELPTHIEKLTIIPDSYLYQIPLDILPVTSPSGAQSYGDATYLIERFRTNYKTSLNDFNVPVSTKKYTSDYAGFGVSQFDDERTALVPLPQATTEITTISQQLTAFKNRKTYLNSEATEQAFRRSAPEARILHLATHSEVSGRDPMFSSIYLSRSDQDNKKQFPGRIFAYELFELNLQNDLVMLNSCESGSGSYLQGTGVVGISRALRYAGAQSLVLNLWSVNDMMASDFAIKFYEGINEGQSKSEALRNTKLHFLKNKNANPHYWGSYMLLGNEGPIVKPNKFSHTLVAASFIIFFFSLVIASTTVEIWRRRKRGNIFPPA